MHKVKSMFLTILCMGIILGAGYLVIMESGRKVLEDGIMLEETDYDSTSSNIFYGKIDEDIELFPWNYYPGDEAEIGWKNEQGTHPMFQYIIMSDSEEEIEEELKALQSWYLYNLIACKANCEPEEVWDIFDKRQHTLMDEIRIVENSPIGPLFFYQDVLTLRQKPYQVRIACTQWNIISFICIADGEEPEPGNSDWEKGKEKLVKILEESGEQLTEYFDYMSYLRDWDDTVFYVESDDITYANCYLESLQWLERIQKGEVADDYELSQILNRIQDNKLKEAQALEQMELEDDVKKISAEEASEDAETSVENIFSSEDDIFFKDGDIISEESNSVIGGSDEMVEDATGEVDYNLQAESAVEPDSNFSYQIVDLKDMILLLMQSESTLGIFYDPITQEFCGYNFFYEY